MPRPVCHHALGLLEGETSQILLALVPIDIPQVVLGHEKGVLIGGYVWVQPYQFLLDSLRFHVGSDSVVQLARGAVNVGQVAVADGQVVGIGSLFRVGGGQFAANCQRLISLLLRFGILVSVVEERPQIVVTVAQDYLVFLHPRTAEARLAIRLRTSSNAFWAGSSRPWP